MKRRSALLALLLLATPLVAGEGKTVKLLTVGNSFSQNATHYLGDIAKAAGDTLVLGTANVGGSPMELHWNKAQLHEKDPADKAGQYTMGRGLREWLQADKWDVVTIQQASIKSHDLATYRPYAAQLRDYIRKYAPQAEVVLHQTWEYRVDDPRFSPTNTKPGEPKTQDEMYAQLANAYATIARELGVRRLPVGDAFHAANRDPQWGFRVSKVPFPGRNVRIGVLPDQTHSLNVGWVWKKGAKDKMMLSMDGHHANTAGEYLGACVWYEALYGRSVEGNPYVPKGLDAAYAKFLQSLAHRTVASAPDATTPAK